MTIPAYRAIASCKANVVFHPFALSMSKGKCAPQSNAGDKWLLYSCLYPSREGHERIMRT